MGDENDTQLIVKVHLRKLRDRRVELQQDEMHAILRIFTLGDHDAALTRSMVIDVASIDTLYNQDTNVIHALMLCITPRKTLELFPNLQENIWALGRSTMRRAWRTREAVRLSNDLASSGLMFCVDSVTRGSLNTALVYFAARGAVVVNKHAIDSMKHTLNIDAGMFAEFTALSAVLQNAPLEGGEMKTCMEAVLYQSPNFIMYEMSVVIAPFTVLFDENMSSPSGDPRRPNICAYDVMSNICAAVGIELPTHIQSKTSFGPRKLIYFPRLSCMIKHAALDICIPLAGGTIAVLNHSMFWAPPAALQKGFQMGASPVSAQLSIESTFTPETSLSHSLSEIHRFYETFMPYALGMPDNVIEEGRRVLMDLLHSLDRNDLYSNEHTDNAILSIFCILIENVEEENIGDSAIISILAHMHSTIDDLDDLMDKIGRILPGARYADKMPLGALIIEYPPAPQYVDPCLWACMHYFQTPDILPPAPAAPPADIFTELFEESKIMLADYATWNFAPAPVVVMEGGFLGEAMDVDKEDIFA